MTMGEKIKYHRERLNMTLEELGNKVGVGKSTVRKWENGMIANMKRDKIANIASALNVNPGYLMGWTDDPDSSYAEKQEEQYYTDPETARYAQKAFENDYMRILFDAADGSRPEDIEMAAEMLRRMKQTNPEG